MRRTHRTRSARRSVLVGLSLLGCLVAGSALAAPAASEPLTLQTLMRGMAEASGVVADYVEVKELALLQHPIRSRGRLYFVPPDRMVRHTTEPAESRLLVDGERIARAAPAEWLSHGRGYGEQRYSPLSEISAENVSELAPAWVYPTGQARGHEATPIVVDGVLYATTNWSIVFALDAQTGRKLWRYDPQVPREKGRDACCDVVNRGVAVWKGRVMWGRSTGA